MLRYLRFALLLWFFASWAEAQGGNETDLAEIYWDVLTSYHAFPPLDTAAVWQNGTVEPIQAVIAAIVVSVDVISPATSEFTVGMRKLLYWNREACNQTEAHQHACDNPILGLHFLTAKERVGDPEINYELHRDEAHTAEFAALGLPELTPSLDIVEEQVTFKQQFDMRTYPYEYHNLEIAYTSLYSSNIVNLTTFPVDAGAIIPSVPAGWTLQDVNCVVSTGQEGRAITEVSQGEIFFMTLLCTIQVSRRNTGWWMTSFLLFIGLNFMAFFGGLGLTSHVVAEAKDDKDKAREGLFDGMRINGVFSLGLLLTYVFQVEISPYGQSLEYWPSTAASTMIYILGLAGILVSSMVAMLMGLLAKKYLVVDGYTGGIKKAYDLKNVPVEGKQPEEAFPLRDIRKESPEQIPEPPKNQPSAAVFTKAKTHDKTGAEVKGESGVHPSPTADVTEGAGDEEVESHPAVMHAIPPVEKEDPPGAERAPVSRGGNTKRYNVLSGQEARVVNQFVWFDLIARVVGECAQMTEAQSWP